MHHQNLECEYVSSRNRVPPGVFQFIQERNILPQSWYTSTYLPKTIYHDVDKAVDYERAEPTGQN